MDTLINELEKLSLSENNQDEDIESLCINLKNLVIKEDIKIDELISQFNILEIRTGKKIDQRLWNSIFSLINKPNCWSYQELYSPKYIQAL